MIRFLIILLFTFSKGVPKSKPNFGIQESNQNRDTTIFLFNDSNYRLRLRLVDSLEHQPYNAALSFVKKQGSKVRTLFIDSLFCRSPRIQMKDINNDRIRDVLVFYMYDVRGNEMYYLYLVDQKSKRLIRVEGFEEVKNPELDPKENVISSFAVSGTDYYSFYRINKKNKLIDLNKTFNCYHDGRDSVNYQKRIQQIRKMKQD